MSKTIELDIECPSCQGTGVHSKRDGAAVICNRCEGTGRYKYKFTYTKFTGLKKRKGISRVYLDSYGFDISTGIVDFKNIGLIDMDVEGVSYEEFLEGKTPEHIKSLACPLLADQSTCREIPGFVDVCDNLDGGLLLGRLIYQCKYYPNKAKCWKKFDKGLRDEHNT